MELDAAPLRDCGYTAVRQLARPERTSSTGVGALSSDAKTCGWSASRVDVLFRECSVPSPKKSPITERLCVPFNHAQLARHLNCAACGACSKAWRAPSSALTLTPLSAFARGEMVVVMVMVSVSCAVSWLIEPCVRFCVSNCTTASGLTALIERRNALGLP